MIATLRQLAPEEALEVARQVGPGSGAGAAPTPEEVIRALCRLTGATTLLVLPAATEDALLDHVGRRLGLSPLVAGARALVQREQAVFAAYLRQAWEAAGGETRREVLRLALAAWDHPALPRPEPTHVDDASLRLSLESLLQHSAGLRALAVATAELRLPLPAGLSRPAVGVPAFGAPLRSGGGHEAMYAVLQILWRARARLLRDRRAQRAHLERQIAQAEALLAVRRRQWSAGPRGWTRNPASGLSLTAAAAVSLAANAALSAASAVTVLPALVVGAAGLAWSALAATARPRPQADPRLTKTDAQLQSLQTLRQRVAREIYEVETE